MTEPGHFMKICKECGTLITQCRCFDKNKPVTYGVCNSCLKKVEGELIITEGKEKEEPEK